MRAMRSVRFAPLVALVACAQLQNLAGSTGAKPPDPPKFVIASVGLANHPGPDTVARALCPRVAPGLVCAALGGAPSPAELRIGFAVQLDVTNPNTIPLPLVEALVAFTAYPGPSGANNLGAVCLSFCDQGANCPMRPDACTGGGPQIRTIDDFKAAAAGFLVAAATGQVSPDNLKIRTLAPNQTTRVTVALELDPEQVVALIARFATTALDQVKHGSVPKFEIPYSIEGSAWVTVQGFGKIAAGFGPVQGVWVLQ
jgi:hypothetical protein